MFLVTILEPFEKCEIDFVGLINPLAHRTCVYYIINDTKYLMR
jgi:hypothetical protein